MISCWILSRVRGLQRSRQQGCRYSRESGGMPCFLTVRRNTSGETLSFAAPSAVVMWFSSLMLFLSFSLSADIRTDTAACRAWFGQYPLELLQAWQSASRHFIVYPPVPLIRA